MRQRGVVIALHWVVVMLILGMVKGGASSPWVLWIFVAAVTLWTGITIFHGLRAKPGPRLSYRVRRLYPWMHRALHTLLALTAIAILFRLIGRPLWWLDAWVMLVVTLGAGTFHGVFHFWRHTALYDNALALITPRFMHRWL